MLLDFVWNLALHFHDVDGGARTIIEMYEKATPHLSFDYLKPNGRAAKERSKARQEAAKARKAANRARKAAMRAKKRKAAEANVTGGDGEKKAKLEVGNK